MANPNFDQYLTTTLNNHRAELVDGVFEAYPLAHFLKEANSVRADGGNKLVTPINFAKNATVGSYAGTDQLDISASPGPTAAEYSWKQHSGAIQITGIEEGMNAGSERIMSILDFRTKQLKESIADDWNTMFWGDGTGNSGKDFNGLAHLVFQNAAAVGNIDPTVETNWATTLTAVGGALTLPALYKLFNDISFGAARPNVCISTQEGFEAFEQLMADKVRYEDEDTANAGFTNLMMKSIPFTFDRACPAGTVAMLNTEYLEFVTLGDNVMRPEPFFKPGDRDYRTANVLTYGELAVTSRRHQGALTGVTDA